ncbi:MAG: hypothetical protein WA823_19595 [Candidatus Acidiferrales bacterium]
MSVRTIAGATWRVLNTPIWGTVHRQRPLRSGQRGFAYIMALIAVMVVVATSTVVLQQGATQARRNREQEMIWRGNQYKRAIRLYYHKTGKYPQTIDDLVKGLPQLHFLRQEYKDPTNKADGTWRFIYVNAAGSIIGSTKYATLQQMQLLDMNGGVMPTIPGQPGVPASSLATGPQPGDINASGQTSSFSSFSSTVGPSGQSGSQTNQNGSNFNNGSTDQNGGQNPAGAPISNGGGDSSNPQNPPQDPSQNPIQNSGQNPSSQFGSGQSPFGGGQNQGGTSPSGMFGQNGILPSVGTVANIPGGQANLIALAQLKPTGPVDGPVLGGFLTGVGSKTDAASIKRYNGAKKLNQFEFIWNPLEDAAAALQNQMSNMQGNVLGQGSTSATGTSTTSGSPGFSSGFGSAFGNNAGQQPTNQSSPQQTPTQTPPQ